MVPHTDTDMNQILTFAVQEAEAKKSQTLNETA